MVVLCKNLWTLELGQLDNNPSFAFCKHLTPIMFRGSKKPFYHPYLIYFPFNPAPQLSSVILPSFISFIALIICNIVLHIYFLISLHWNISSKREETLSVLDPASGLFLL